MNNGRNITLQIVGPDQAKAFTFTSQEMVKTTQDQALTLKVQPEPLELLNLESKEMILEKKTPFKVVSLDRIAEQNQSGFVLSFSDLLAKSQPSEGFIAITPTVKVKTKISEDKMYVFGNFTYGQEYKVQVRQGLKNYWEEKLTNAFNGELYFEDFKPELRFVRPGVFLPSSNQSKISFQSINVRAAQLQVFQVFSNNLGQFMQTQSLRGQRKVNQNNFHYSVYRQVGVLIKEQKIDIGETKNLWLTSELDLQEILAKDEKGLFIVSLNFTRLDSLYATNNTQSDIENEDGEDNYERRNNNPNEDGYYNANGTISMPVIASDIGMLVKKGLDTYTVFTNHLVSTDPIAGVNIRLMSYQNQVIAHAQTDLSGKVVFEKVKGEVFYVEGEWKGQRSVVKPSDMAWNLTGYDISGVENTKQGIRAFIYTDRGVYRPGETINLSVIARNQENTFPDNHPITLKLENPRNQVALETTTRTAKDGFYNFSFTTKPEDPTGDWVASLLVGDARFAEKIKVETVVPNRLKVALQPKKPTLGHKDKMLVCKLVSKYLYGAPAVNLRAEVSATLNSSPLKFPAYPNFTFQQEGTEYQPVEAKLLEGNLDERGEAR
jgi:hypothetical protein